MVLKPSGSRRFHSPSSSRYMPQAISLFPALKTAMVRWSVKWLVPSFLLMPLLLGWYLWMVPESQRQLLSLGMSTIGSGAFTQVTRAALVIVMSSATILGIAYFLAYRNPLDFSFSHAVAVLVVALMATGSAEYSREMLRKPYVVGRHMFSNGMRVKSVAAANRDGYLTHSIWLRTNVSPQYANGEAMFRGQCMSCHTVDGYRSIRELLNGRNRAGIGNLLTMLHEYKADSPYRKFMPPLTGTEEEVRQLGDYLDHLENGTQGRAVAVAAAR